MAEFRHTAAKRLCRYKIDPETGCWLWTGANFAKSGYGQIRVVGRASKIMMAHRYFYEQLVGPIPDGMDVCHRCDRPICVNPAHLFLGTHLENMRDKMAKGRHVSNPLTGEACKWAKLNDAKVRAILLDDRTQAAIAREYGVAPSAISLIKSGKHWKHIYAETFTSR